MSQAGERTEKATPKRRREARKRGQVLKSTELSSALMLLMVSGVLSVFGGNLIRQIMALMTGFLGGGAGLPETMTIAETTRLFAAALQMVASAMLPILAGAAVGAVVVNVAQTGLVFKTGDMVKMDRINPMKGFKRIFSSDTAVDLVKSLLKLAVIGVVAYQEYRRQMVEIPQWMGLTVPVFASRLGSMLVGISMKSGMALLGFAVADYFLQWRRYEKQLMMTRQEVREEYKLTEGDPQIKNRIRQKQRQMSTMRMMGAVKSSNVVVANPTHYAVALNYAEGHDIAPRVVAKGADFLARRIRETARKHHVEIVEDKPLARSLYDNCNVGDEVPRQLYKAVAEILAYVYRLKHGGKGGARA